MKDKINKWKSLWYYETLGWRCFWLFIGKLLTLPFNIIGKIVEEDYELEFIPYKKSQKQDKKQ